MADYVRTQPTEMDLESARRKVRTSIELPAGSAEHLLSTSPLFRAFFPTFNPNIMLLSCQWIKATVTVATVNGSLNVLDGQAKMEGVLMIEIDVDENGQPWPEDDQAIPYAFTVYATFSDGQLDGQMNIIVKEQYDHQDTVEVDQILYDKGHMVACIVISTTLMMHLNAYVMQYADLHKHPSIRSIYPTADGIIAALPQLHPDNNDWKSKLDTAGKLCTIYYLQTG